MRENIADQLNHHPDSHSKSEYSSRTNTGWQKSEISLNNYQNYLKSKSDRFELSLIDLLYISNFKGGNATINEEAEKLRLKLKAYTAVLRDIDQQFTNRSLSSMATAETNILINLVNQLVRLCSRRDTSIDGFKSSYLSALLHSFFPLLIPILDRRLLINLNLVTRTDLLSTKQIRKIEEFYPQLIFKIRELSIKSSKTVRQLDQEYFIIELPAWAK